MDLFQITHVINTGVAGSLNADLDIGDILISKDAIHHDVDATVFGYPLGELPQMGIREFIADETLVNLAVESCKKVNPDLTVRTGRVVSGDQFISSDDVKKRLIEVFHGDCAEMEGASIAHGAYLNKIPFIVIRAISDSPHGGEVGGHRVDALLHLVTGTQRSIAAVDDNDLAQHLTDHGSLGLFFEQW